MLKVCVVGVGYVGLVTGTCLAEIGHDVTCVDCDAAKVATLRAGRISIYEPGLAELVRGNAVKERLRFSEDLAGAIRGDDLVLVIAVGTPTGHEGLTADLDPLFAAVEEAARARAAAVVGGFMTFVIKSTVPVGTCRAVEVVVARYLAPGSFAVVSNPEFLREGSAVDDFMKPDRIVVGSTSPEGFAQVRALYEPLTRRGRLLFETAAVETSEMIKYASNIFLATKIGLINEFSRLCERVGGDVEELAAGIGLDRRIGPSGLRAGPGFGGSCFPKDLRALVGLAALFDSPMPIAAAVIASNERQKRYMTERIVEEFDGDVEGVRIAVLGLSFKAETDDVREAPALAIIEDLMRRGCKVSAYDPEANGNARRLLPLVDYRSTVLEAVTGADAVVVATEWPMFRELDWKRLGGDMLRPLVFDLRNCLDAAALAGAGLDHIGLGRPPSRASNAFAPRRGGMIEDVVGRDGAGARQTTPIPA